MRAPHIVPLSRQAVETLKELRPLSGNSPFLFPSKGTEGYMSNRAGPVCLNNFSASISGASAGVRLPSGGAAG